MPSAQLVVARYAESLNWLRRVPRSIEPIILDKNPDSPWPGSVPLPNIGREAHSYLHFIVSRYDSLADVSLFCQGHPFDHAFDFHASLRDFAAHPEQVGDFRWLGHIVDTDDCFGRSLFKGWSKNDDGRELDGRGFHRALFGNDGPDVYVFRLGAQFAVSRDLIRSRPLEFWQRALEVSISFPDAAHLFERTWDEALGVVGVDRAWLGERKTVYLKKVKRLEE